MDGLGEVCDPNEIPLPGDCGRIYEVAVHQFVHPLDLVALPFCDQCGPWQPPGMTISVILSSRDPSRVTVVDDEGQVVAKSTPGRQHALSFNPAPGFSYRAPGRDIGRFHATGYHLRLTSLVEADEENEIEFEVEIEE